MTTPVWVAVGVACWLAVATAVAFVVGPRLLSDDRDRPDVAVAGPEDANGDWLVHRCPRCGMDIEYTEEAQLPAVRAIHGVLCRTSTSSPPGPGRPGRDDGAGRSPGDVE